MENVGWNLASTAIAFAIILAAIWGYNKLDKWLDDDNTEY